MSRLLGDRPRDLLRLVLDAKLLLELGRRDRAGAAYRQAAEMAAEMAEELRDGG